MVRAYYALFLVFKEVDNLKERKGKIGAIVVLILLLTAIVAILNFNGLQGKAAKVVSNKDLHVARHHLQKKKPTYDMSKVKEVSPGSLASAYRNRRNYRAVGQIAINQDRVLLNIYRGVGNDVLNLGAGTFRKDQKMGENNYPLAAHNMDDNSTFFSPLFTAKTQGRLTNGTKIYLTDFKKVYYYEITSSKFISTYNLALTFNRKKFAEKPVVSLFTCDLTGQGRLFIRGRLTGSERLNSASSYIRNSFAL